MEPSKPSRGARKARRKDKKRTGHTDYRTTGLVIETLAKMTSPTVSLLDLTGKIVKRSREAYQENTPKNATKVREKPKA